ncbi:MAG: omptin family outer membrane protease [Treponema sp.]
MKRKLFFALLFFLCSAAFCKKNDFLLSIEPFFGSRNGNVVELLLEGKDGAYKKKSELVWSHANSLYAGAKVDFGWKWLYADAFAAAFIPNASGKMFDSDWMDLNGVKNDFSISDNFINLSSFFAGGALGLSVPLLSRLEVTPQFSFEYEYLLFNAKDGYGWYGDAAHSKTGKNVPWNSIDAAYIQKGGLFGISYDRRTCFTWLGLSLTFFASPELELSASAFVSPFIFIESLDHHENRAAGAFYYDRMYDFFSAGKIDFGMGFHINRMFGIKTLVTITYVHQIDGETFSNAKGKFENYYALRGYRAGASAQYLDMRISFVYTPLSRSRAGLFGRRKN